MANKDRMQKLLAMADKGTEAERKVARKMLDTLMRKHGVTEDDIRRHDTQERSVRWFTCNRAWKDKLLQQIIYSVLCEPDFMFGTSRLMGRHKRATELSDAEYIQVQYMYDVLCASYQRQLDDFYAAFVMANDVYPDRSKIPPKPYAELSKEDIEKIERHERMAKGIQKTGKRAIGLRCIGGSDGG